MNPHPGRHGITLALMPQGTEVGGCMSKTSRSPGSRGDIVRPMSQRGDQLSHGPCRPMAGDAKRIQQVAPWLHLTISCLSPSPCAWFPHMFPGHETIETILASAASQRTGRPEKRSGVAGPCHTSHQCASHGGSHS